MDKNWKTTIGGVLMGLAMMLKSMGIDVPQEVLDALTVLGAFIIGWFAKDKNVTGGNVPQTGEAENRVKNSK